MFRNPYILWSYVCYATLKNGVFLIFVVSELELRLSSLVSEYRIEVEFSCFKMLD